MCGIHGKRARAIFKFRRKALIFDVFRPFHAYFRTFTPLFCADFSDTKIVLVP